jgi:translation initiation factor 4E
VRFSNLIMAEQVDLTTIPISPEGGNNPNGTASEPTADDADKTVTVFHDKDNFNVKHPLSNRWTLWFTKPASGKVRFIFGSLPRRARVF